MIKTHLMWLRNSGKSNLLLEHFSQTNILEYITLNLNRAQGNMILIIFINYY